MANYNYVDKADLIYTLTQLKSKIDGYLGNKVDVVAGKGLSTNDLTDALKSQYDSAQANIIESVKVNGNALTPDASKAVDVIVPTGALASKDKVSTSDLDTALATVIASIDDKVDKVAGKGLSENDFTNALKSAVESALQGIKVNGAVVQAVNNIVDIVIPSAPVQSVSVDSTPLTPDAQGNVNIVLTGKVDKKDGFDLISTTDIAQIATNTAGITANKNAIDTLNADETTAGSVKKQIADAIGGVTQIRFEKVSQLPATGEAGVIYLVPKTKTATNNVYTEWFWDGANFEIMGDTTVDLSGYVQASEMVAVTTAEIDTMFATW